MGYLVYPGDLIQEKVKTVLRNPFTPSEISSQPEDFFGRENELRILERSLPQGSVVIEGPIGIGKSSLLARTRLMMEGFASTHHSRSVIAVGDKGVTSLDNAARLLLESFVKDPHHPPHPLRHPSLLVLGHP